MVLVPDELQCPCATCLGKCWDLSSAVTLGDVLLLAAWGIFVVKGVLWAQEHAAKISFGGKSPPWDAEGNYSSLWVTPRVTKHRDV